MALVSTSQFFSKLFQSRDTAHLTHLRVRSYAQHVALNDYYDGLLGLIDDLIESYQGYYQIVNITIEASKATEPISHLKALNEFIETNRVIFKESCLQNIIDEIQALINKTLYKLINLK